MHPLTFLYVGFGGAIGAMARHLINSLAGRWLPVDEFPYGILTINILGCFLMGVLAGAAAYRIPVGLDMRAFLAVGVLGGFTTFSSFALDIVTMMQRGETVPAMIYIVSSVTLGVIGLSLGMAMFRAAA